MWYLVGCCWSGSGIGDGPIDRVHFECGQTAGIVIDPVVDGDLRLCASQPYSLIISDTGNHRLARISEAKDRIEHIVGSAEYEAGFADGIGTTALFREPAGLCCDSKGTIYVADSGNRKLRMISRPHWTVTTLDNYRVLNSDFKESTETDPDALYPECMDSIRDDVIYVWLNAIRIFDRTAGTVQVPSAKRRCTVTDTISSTILSYRV